MNNYVNCRAPNSKRCLDLSRAYSFLESRPPQRVFRASDLVKGELLGQGFFGQVFKVGLRFLRKLVKTLTIVSGYHQRHFRGYGAERIVQSG